MRCSSLFGVVKVGCVALFLAGGCSSPTGGTGSQGAGNGQGSEQSSVGATVANGTMVDGMTDTAKSAVSYESLSYSSKSDTLAVAGSGGVMLFDASSGVKRTTIDPGRGYAALVAQGNGVLAATLLGDLWLLGPAGVEAHHVQLGNQIYSLALASDDSTVISGGIDGSVHRFHTADGLEVGPPLLPVSQDFVYQVQMSSDGAYVAAATTEGAHIWNAVDGTLAADLSGPATTLAFAPDSRTLAVGTETAVALHAIPDGHTISTYPAATAVAYASDGSKLALSTDGATVTVVDAATGATLITLVDPSPLRQPEAAQTREVAGLAFVGGDSRLAVAWRSGRLTEWQLGDGTLVFSRLDADLP